MTDMELNDATRREALEAARHFMVLALVEAERPKPDHFEPVGLAESYGRVAAMLIDAGTRIQSMLDLSEGAKSFYVARAYANKRTFSNELSAALELVAKGAD